MKRLRIRTYGFQALLALYFLFFLLLNFLTPLVSDDYRYAFSFLTGERITSVWQIFPSLYNHYFTMHGRTAVHFFAQLMLLLGKPVFNVLNAAMATLLVLGLHRMAEGRGRRNPVLLLTLCALSFLFTPAFGQTMLWLDGACNYLWGVTITVWVLVPFRDALLDGQTERTPLRSPLLLGVFLLGSLFMGAASENTSPAALLFMLCVTAILWKKTGKPPVWASVSCALAAVGFLVLVLSPANAIRSAHYAAEGVSGAGQLLLNFQTAAQTFLANGMPLACAFLMLFSAALWQKAEKKRLLLSALLFLAGLAANFAMTLSNGYPLRAMMGCAAFHMAAIGVLLPDVLKGAFRPLALGAAACAVFAACVTALSVLPGNYNRYAEAKAREAYVISEAARGNLNVTTYTLEGKSPYDVFTGMTDITYDETYWPNVYYARFYGVDSVVTDTIR